LVLGQAGSVEGPPRTPPERPGYPSGLRREPWTEHTRGVIAEAEWRARRELPENSQAARVLSERFGVDYAAYLSAARFSALFHDFGKLQQGWQQWASTYELDRDPSSSATDPLAHTAYDGRNPQDREREQRVTGQLGRRPHHAAQGALFAAWAAAEVLAPVQAAARLTVASAVCAAVVSHHGGWLPSEPDLNWVRLSTNWQATLSILASYGVAAETIAAADSSGDKREGLREMLDLTTHPDRVRDHWPLVALLTRVLRLSDQKATAEGNTDV
jgi:CRISPR-associated endonuclease Cas3-HD